MSTSTRLARLLAVLALGAGALAGCGGDAEPVAPEATSYPTEVEKGSTLKIYSWADYISPDNIAAFEAQTGVRVQVDAYASSEEALAKLRLGQGTSGYDLVVIDGSYVPQLIESKALLPWDKERLPALSGVSSTFLGRSWDPDNTFALPKSGGSTGFVWDSSVLPEAPTTWTEFYDSFADPAVDGKTSVVDGAPSFVGSYFWANGIDDQTTDPEDYAAAEDYFAEAVLPNLKEFNAYPSSALATGDLVLAQAFTGDARRAMIDGPDTLRFALGSPQTDIYVDHWVLPEGSANLAAAHAFVQFLLEPEHAAAETEFHGYYTGVEKTQELLADTPFPEIVFFDAGQPADRFVPAAVTPEARKLAVATFQRLKARASS